MGRGHLLDATPAASPLYHRPLHPGVPSITGFRVSRRTRKSSQKIVKEDLPRCLLGFAVLGQTEDRAERRLRKHGKSGRLHLHVRPSMDKGESR